MAKKRIFHSLTLRMMAVVCLAAIIAAGVFGMVKGLSNWVIENRYLENTASEKRAFEEITSFRDFVADARAASTDTETMAVWSREHPNTALTIYGKVAVMRYTAKGAEAVVSTSGMTVRTGDEGRVWEYAVNFADGAFTVAVEELSHDRIRALWTVSAIVLAAIVFLLPVLAYDAQVTASVRRLGRQVCQVSRGDLEMQITPTTQDEIGELALDVEAMRLSIIDKLQREADAWNANSQLITAVSHDVRTPLTALMGYLEILAEGDLPPEQQQRFLDVCRHHASRLRELTDELFDFFLVFGQAAPEQQLEEFDAGMLLEQILGEHAAELREMGYTVRYVSADAYGRTIRADLRHLRRVFDNLFSNIRKYADPAEPVSILETAADGQLQISFTNSPAADTGRVESTGIGLKTCDKLMTAMGGGFTRVNTPTVFTATVTIPIEE